MKSRQPARSFLILSTALLAVACGAADQRPSTRAVVLCTQALPSGLNPFVTQDVAAADLVSLLYTPLVRYDDSGGFAPYLAREWTWSADGREVTFVLRDDVTWHDGSPLTAEDVAWSIRTASDSTYAYLGPALDRVEEVTVPGDGSVRVRLAAPSLAGVEPFAGLPILPRHLLAEVPAADFARAPYHREPVGSGPYRFAGRLPDGSLRFERYDDFPGELGVPQIGRLFLRAVPEGINAQVGLTTGELDLCVAPAGVARALAEAPDIDMETVPPAAMVVIPLNTAKQPLGDSRVRRALSAALDRSEIAALISPVAEPARTFLPHGNPDVAPELAQPDADTALAAALLDSAGWNRIGPDGVRRNAAGEPLRFEFMGAQPSRELMTQIQAQLARVGAQADLRVMEASAYYGLIGDPERRPAAMMLGFVPDRVLNPDPWSQLHSEGESNLTGFRSAATDSLVSRLRVASDAEERRRIHTELQARLAEDVPMLYIAYIPRLMAVGSRVQNVRADLNGPFASIAGWRILD